MNSMSRRIFVAALALMAVGPASAAPAVRQSASEYQCDAVPECAYLRWQERLSLSAPSSVLVKGNTIERISTTPIPIEPGVAVIAGNGRTLMPA
jgi:hypothetical protein